MEKRKFFILVLTISVAIFLSGCGFTNQKPEADFSVSPSDGEAPLEVSLDAGVSNDPDGELVSYTWDYGDGDEGSGKTKVHTFDNAGQYKIELTVTDNDGETDKSTATVTVISPPPPPPE